MRKLILTLVLAGFAAITNAQLKYGGDVSSAFTFNLQSRAGIPMTTSLDLALDQFRFLGGIDMYIFNGAQKNLFGPQFSGKYFFRYMAEEHNFFAETNYSSVKYGTNAEDMLTRYKNISLDEAGMSKVRSSVATLGGGYALKPGRSLSFYCSAGGGLNFLNTRTSSVSSQRGYATQINQSKTLSTVFYVRVGVNFTVNEDEHRRICCMRGWF